MTQHLNQFSQHIIYLITSEIVEQMLDISYTLQNTASILQLSCELFHTQSYHSSLQRYFLIHYSLHFRHISTYTMNIIIIEEIMLDSDSSKIITLHSHLQKYN